MNARSPKPILIAGATASGKSALALAIAERLGGVVINADSMQVYTELPIVTAQPSAAEQARAPHRLYGHVPAREAYSTGRYLVDVARALHDASTDGLRPIIVGGTGLYFKALLEGLSPVPDIPEPTRTYWRTLAEQASPGELHRLLAQRDLTMAERLPPGDTQRITRALEVIDATGQSLAAWQGHASEPLLDAESCIKLVIDRPREGLVMRTDQRFVQMIEAGAVDEVRTLARLELSSALPAMRALGVKPLHAHIAGKLSLAAAIAASQTETRQYVKRQQTWLKRHMIAWNIVVAHEIDNLDTLNDRITFFAH
jgi:tRNA dimethylallyltransferase